MLGTVSAAVQEVELRMRVCNGPSGSRIIGPRDVAFVQAVKDSVGPFSDSWPWARDGVLCNLFHVLAHGRHRGIFTWKGR